MFARGGLAMNVLTRRGTELFPGDCKCCLRRLHAVTGSRVPIRSTERPGRLVSLRRNFSSTPTVCAGVSRVPGSGTKDVWNEDVLHGSSSSTADVLQGDGLQVVSDVAPQDLASLGLGTLYTPVGWVQIFLDSLHATTGLPWWGTIAITTAVLRLCLFPLSIKFAKNAAKMAKLQPELAEAMKKIQHFSKIGAKELAQKEQIRVTELYKSHGCSPLTMMTLPFMQLPFFMSFFIGLRKMAMAPLDSMKSGGMWWFTDLTVPDPTYALPLIACGLFITNIQVYTHPLGHL